VFRITIGGFRDFNDNYIFKQFVDECLEKLNIKKEIVILSGHCRGVDKMAENYAMESGYLLEIYPAEWGKYGRAAGPKRNEEMVEKSNAVIAFWNGKSKGTENLIHIAKRKGITLFVKNL